MLNYAKRLISTTLLVALGCPWDAVAESNIRHYLANPQGYGAALSPTGNRIALLTVMRDKPTVLVWDLEKDQRRPILQFPDKKAQLAWVRWANDDRLLFSVDMPYVLSRGVRARTRRLYAIDASGGEPQHLARKWFGRGDRSKTYRSGEEFGRVPIQYEDNILSMLRNDPEHVLIEVQNPRKSDPGVYRLNVNSGKLKRVLSSQDRVMSWTADPQGTVRVGLGGVNNKRWLVARATGDQDFERIYQWVMYEEDALYHLGFADNPNILYVSSDHEGDRDAVYEFDITTKKIGKRVFAHPRVDVADAVRLDPVKRTVTAFEYVGDHREAHFIDPAAEKLQAAIDRALPNRINVIQSYSTNGRRMLIHSSGGSSGPRYYFFDRDAGRMDELFSMYPKLDEVKLGEVRPVSYQARDGLTIPAFLTIPADSSGKKMPVVVLPHGGPSGRDEVEFDAENQFLASRGYAVFQPNFRGSTGYGNRHRVSGYKQWGLAMQDDITDGVRWLVEQGIADPNRIAIYGGSYGGYAALMGLIKTPELFRCGASLAGVTDLFTLLSDDDWYRGTEEHNAPTVGSAWGDSDQLKATSPARNVDKIQVPVLIAHGEADSRVHVKQAHAFADAMKDAGKSVELAIFEDEIHGLRDEGYRIEFYEKLIAFLDRNMQPK